MSWKRWRLGLAVSCFSGLLTGVLGIGLEMQVRAIFVMMAVNAAKDILLYLANNSVDKIKDID